MPETPQVRLADIRANLDAAMIRLRLIEDAEVDVEASESALGEALRHVYAALAGNDDFRLFRDEVDHAVDDVRSALAHLMAAPTDDIAASEICQCVAKCLGDLQQVGWVMLETWLPRSDRYTFPVATHSVPRLLDLSRRVLEPGVPLSIRPPSAPAEAMVEVLEAPKRTLEEIEALARETQARMEAFEAAQAKEPDPEPKWEEPPEVDEEAIDLRFGARITTEALLIERATDCMDDLSMLGRMRRCTPPEPWASGEDSESRMLTKVDAIAACGVDAFSELVRMLDDRPIPDPELTFGNLFFLGSLAGDDAWDQMLRLLEVSELDEPAMLAMAIDALVFTPHPRIDQLLPRWLSHPIAERRALAVEVLRRRRTLTPEAFSAVGHDPDVRVLASAARSLPTLTGPVPPGALSWFLQHESEEVVRAALESSMRMRREVGYQRAVNLVAEGRGAFADAILFVAISGTREAKPIVEHEVASTSAPVALRAAGWFGDASVVPFLLGRLRDGDEGEQAAALEALERITGASIVDASIVPEYRPAETPFAREPRAYEPPGLLDGTAEAWSAWWEAWRSGVVDGTRYRWGQKWQIRDNLLELSVGDFLQRDRPWASMELSVRGGAPAHLDWTDWVFRQRRAVGELGRALASRAAIDGWPSYVGSGR